MHTYKHTPRPESLCALMLYTQHSKGSRYAARFKFLRAKLHNLAVADITTKDEGTIDTPE